MEENTKKQLGVNHKEAEKKKKEQNDQAENQHNDNDADGDRNITQRAGLRRDDSKLDTQKERKNIKKNRNEESTNTGRQEKTEVEEPRENRSDGQ